MKKSIEKLLVELINGEKAHESSILKQSKESMNITDYVLAKDALLNWQKHISIDRGEFYMPKFLPNEMKVNPKAYPRLQLFFFHCPELKEIFTLEKDRVTYNEELSQAEREEIRTFIGQNHLGNLRVRMPNNND